MHLLLVGMAGFEPAALAPQTPCSGQTELHSDWWVIQESNLVNAAMSTQYLPIWCMTHYRTKKLCKGFSKSDNLTNPVLLVLSVGFEPYILAFAKLCDIHFTKRVVGPLGIEPSSLVLQTSVITRFT